MSITIDTCGGTALTSQAPNARLKPREPWQPIVARVSAAILGGYALTYTAGAAAAKFLPMAPSEAVYLISVLQLTLYVGVILWTFSVTGARAWVTLLVLSGLCLAAAHFG